MATAIACGFLGGLLVELAKAHAMARTDEERPSYYGTVGYWVTAFFMCAAGAMLVWIYQDPDVEMNKLLALNIGVSAPLIITALGLSTPDIGPGKTE